MVNIESAPTYLAYRLAHGIGTELEATRYRGLLPHQPLLYSGREAAMSQNTKKRDMDTVAVLLGHSSIDCSQRYVDVDPATLKAMFSYAIPDSCVDR